MDFAKAVENARKVPDTADAPFDPFAPQTVRVPSAPFVDTKNDPQKIEGVPSYPGMTYFCRRFYMGRELREIIDNTKYFDDRDESGELKAIYDKHLQGKAIIWNRKDAILGEGSVVVWLEWSEKVPSATPSKDQLSIAALKSPERITPRSEAADKADLPGAPISDDTEEEEERGPNFDNEEDW
jgi:hypothetical protein